MNQEDSTAAVRATGVDWCEITLSDGLLKLVDEARSNEKLVRALSENTQRLLIRAIATDGVSAASDMAADAGISDDELFGRCFALKGEPFCEASARRDMRERIRVLQRIERRGNDIPRTLDDVLDLWSEAVRGEVPLYAECETAQFRTSRVPFAHRKNPFEAAEPIRGRETVEADRIEHETRALLAFMARTDLPREIVAAASHFLCGHIHPFSDGNGRLSRMLACMLLSCSYSHATVLAFLRRLQVDRGTMNLAMARTVRAHGDLEEVANLFLGMLCAAQRDLLPTKAGFVSLPLRIVRTEGLELIAARKPGREVYRTGDGRILKMVAEEGRLTRAVSVYEAISAACEAGAAIARTDELVRTEKGYAMVQDFAEGSSLDALVAQGQMTPKEAGAMLARCLLGLHSLRGDATRMRDVREPFLRMAQNLSPLLSPHTAEALRNTISGLPPVETLVHCDAHMGNVIVGKDGAPTLIDADTVSIGAPVVDLACSYSTMVCEAIIDPVRAERFHGMGTEAVRAVWESLMRHYCTETDMACSGETNRQMEALAWMLVLNRLDSAERKDAPFGEGVLSILRALSCLAQALGNA